MYQAFSQNKKRIQYLVLYVLGFVKILLRIINYQKYNNLRYCQEINRLLIDEEGQLLCYDEPSDKLEEENLRICFPLSLFLGCFLLGHYNEMGEHMGATKTYANTERFYYCLIGYVLWQPTALPARTTNLNWSIETKFHSKNGKTKQFFSALYTYTIKDLFTQLVLVTSMVFESLMHSLDSWWHIQ